MKFEKHYRVRINYKSGQHFEGWFKEFKMQSQDADAVSCNWTACKHEEFILFLGIDNIESVRVVANRKRLVWRNK